MLLRRVLPDDVVAFHKDFPNSTGGILNSAKTSTYQPFAMVRIDGAPPAVLVSTQQAIVAPVCSTLRR